MSLHSWQTAFMDVLSQRAPAHQILDEHESDLAPQEYARLVKTAQSRGATINNDVVCWWRQSRLSIALPFTLRLIERLHLSYLFAHYQKRPCITLFFLREAQEFKQFLEQQRAPAVATDMAAFECMLHESRFVDSDRAVASSTNGHTLTLTLRYCPEQCIKALMEDTPLPQPHNPALRIEFNRAWPGGWRLSNKIRNSSTATGPAASKAF